MSDRLVIRVLGAARLVRPGRTILASLLALGYGDLRACGCRLGDCGECIVTLRRQPGGAVERALACLVEATEGMEILRLPFPWTAAFQRAQKDADDRSQSCFEADEH